MNTKPCDDGEGVASDKTSENLTYPNPNIERDKVEESIWRQYEEFQSLPTIEALQHRYAPVWLDIRDLLSLLDAQRSMITVSEKRAEEAERSARTLGRLCDIFKEERDEARSSLMRVRDEALEEAAKICDDEKDEFRRIVDEGEGAPLKVCALSCANVAFALACRIRDFKARSALSPHPERENG